MRKKLPPYSKGIVSNNETIWIFNGYHKEVFQLAKNTQSNSLCLALWEDPAVYSWPVKNRDVIVFNCSLESKDEWINRTVLSLLQDGAIYIVTYCIPNHHEIHYKRSLSSCQMKSKS